MADSSISRYQLLAADYDGTLAHHGVVAPATVDALKRLRDANKRLVMVTGRRIPSLVETFAHTQLFDLIVAENGALVYEPATERVTTLAEAPPPELVAALQSANVPATLGYSIVETLEPHHTTILELIRKTGVEWHIIFNKGSVMVLPAGITKRTGLVQALRQLAIEPSATIGAGDAENDHAFLSYCGLSVAVANALPSLKAEADIVTTGVAGAGVTEVIDAWLDGRLERVDPMASSTLST